MKKCILCGTNNDESAINCTNCNAPWKFKFTVRITTYAGNFYIYDVVERNKHQAEEEALRQFLNHPLNTLTRQQVTLSSFQRGWR